MVQVSKYMIQIYHLKPGSLITASPVEKEEHKSKYDSYLLHKTGSLATESHVVK